MNDTETPMATADGALQRSPVRSRPNQRRFDRLVRLTSEAGFDRLEAAHVMVFGVGGVGGFAVEGLARCGIGRLTLVDYDVVCATNVNRQIQALQGAVGQPKVALLAERCRKINPQIQIHAVQAFYQPKEAEALLPAQAPPDFVIDAIDHIAAKAHLIDRCKTLNIPVVSSMGAAGKLDPTAVRVADLFATHGDPLARAIRKHLRQKLHWPGGTAGGAAGVTAIFSAEPRLRPIPPAWDAQGFECLCPSSPDGTWGKDNDFHACTDRPLIEGSAVFVTSVFGMVAASVVVRAIVGQLAAKPAAARDQAPDPPRDEAPSPANAIHA